MHRNARTGSLGNVLAPRSHKILSAGDLDFNLFG
jgi:hypothetical protein